MLNEQCLEEWDMVRSEVMFAYNTSVHSTTGFTPYFLMFGVEARVPSEILRGLPEIVRTPAAYAFQRYQKLGVASEADRESAYTAAKKAKDYYDMGAIQKQFSVGDNVSILMAQLNRPATTLHSKWSKIYQIVAEKGVLATVQDLEMKESITVHVDRLTFSSARLRDELATEPFLPFDVPYRSVSNSSLPELFGEGPLERPNLPTPTPLQDPTPRSGSLDFLDQPRAKGKLNVRRNRAPDYAYLFMSLREMTTPDYSGAQNDEIRREQSRRAKVPPVMVDLNAYYGVGDQIIVVTVQEGAMFIHGRTDTLFLQGRCGRVRKRIRRSMPQFLYARISKCGAFG